MKANNRLLNRFVKRKRKLDMYLIVIRELHAFIKVILVWFILDHFYQNVTIAIKQTSENKRKFVDKYFFMFLFICCL